MPAGGESGAHVRPSRPGAVRSRAPLRWGEGGQLQPSQPQLHGGARHTPSGSPSLRLPSLVALRGPIRVPSPSSPWGAALPTHPSLQALGFGAGQWERGWLHWISRGCPHTGPLKVVWVTPWHLG